ALLLPRAPAPAGASLLLLLEPADFPFRRVDVLRHLDLAGADPGAGEVILARTGAVRVVQHRHAVREPIVAAVEHEPRRAEDGRRSQVRRVLLEDGARRKAGAAENAARGVVERGAVRGALEALPPARGL